MSTAWDSSHAPTVAWRSGAWSLDLRDDELADLRYDGRRVLRSIRAVVRDRDWNTAAFTIESVSRQDEGLEVRVTTRALGADIRGTVRAVASGAELRVEFAAVSASEFWTNRTGLVVLHPYQVAGADLAVTHTDGTLAQNRFPREISPHQPVFDIAALSWQDEAVRIDVAFEGDIFEMEDQRNWTDASYKTYSRPLALPFPYRLGAGEAVHQSVTVRAHQISTDVSPTSPADRIDLRADGPFPQIVVGASTAPDPEPPGIPTVGDVLLVEIDLDATNWRAALDRAAARGLPLDVRVVLSTASPALFAALATSLRGVALARIAVFHPEFHVSDASFVEALRTALSDARITAPVIGGSRSHFTELNREGHRLPADLADLVTTVTPLFHSLGTEQLVESLAIQRIVARQTTDFAAGLPVHVGPVALRPRFNNVATSPQPGPSRADLAEGYGAEFTGANDPRQRVPELAAWTIASAAALAIPGVASIAYFEEWGERGIRSATGEPYPVAEAIELLAGLHSPDAVLLWGESPDGLVWAIGAQEASGSTVLVANLDERPREIAVAVAESVAAVLIEGCGFERLVIPLRSAAE